MVLLGVMTSGGAGPRCSPAEEHHRRSGQGRAWTALLVGVAFTVLAALAGGRSTTAAGAEPTTTVDPTTTMAPVTTAAPTTIVVTTTATTISTAPPASASTSTTVKGPATTADTTTTEPSGPPVPSATSPSSTTTPVLTIPTGTAKPPTNAADPSGTAEPDAEEIIPEELPPEMQALIDRYRSIEKTAQQLLAQLDMLNGGISAGQRDLVDASARVAKAEQKVAEIDRRLAATEDELDHQQGVLQERAVAAYMGGSLGAGTDRMILQSASMDDLGKSLAYGSAVVDNERSIIDHTTELRHAIDDLRTEADAEREAAKKGHGDLTAKQAGLEHERDSLLSAQSDLAKNAADKAALLSEAAQTKLSVEAGFAKVQAIRDSINATLAQRQADQVPPVITAGIFLSPIPHPRINQAFGAISDPVFGVTRGHPGLDINGKIGDPIRAPADATVVAAGWIDGYGNCTILDHGNALGTLYGHQSVIVVKDGDTVRRGQIIGFVGSTGYSTGPHLHWEVRVKGGVTDPAPFIGDQN